MSVWLFDYGNTRLKWAPLTATGSTGAVTALADMAAADWANALPEGEAACVASVAHAARTTALLARLAGRFRRVHRVRVEPTLGPLRIAYPIPEHLGVDRFLAMLGLCGHGPLLVAGVGTALTIDLVDAQDQHLGGRIAPAPQLMRSSLHARAPHLPIDGGRAELDFADDTADALASGCTGAALGLIEHSLRQATARLGQPPALYLHGGGGEALRPWLPQAHWRPSAVLDGLARWHGLRLA